MNTLHASTPTHFLSLVCKSFTKQVVLLNCLVTVLLASCGGGGGGDAGPVVSNLSFPLRSGMQASIQQGSSVDYSVSGTCKGDAHLISSTPSPVTFNSAPALAVSNSTTINLSNCSPTVQTNFSNDFYDSNYNLIGTTDASGNYGAFTIPPSIPTSVKVGDVGKIGTINYTDYSKTFQTGHDDISYAVSADTANTAIVTITNKSYDVSGVLTSTTQERYRIKSGGTMIPLSADIQQANGSTQHFILTALPDTTPPTVISANPYNLSTGVPNYTTVSVAFSEAIDPATLTSTSFTLMTGTTPVAGVVTYSGNTAIFTPSAYLNPNTIYKANITPTIKDLAGNVMSSAYTWQFQTAPPDTTPPTVLYTTPPTYGSYGIALNSTISATFSEPIDPATITPASFTVTDGITSVAGSITYSGTTVTLTPSALLAPSTTYTVTLSPSIKDFAGNAMNTSYSWSFQTAVSALPIATVSPSPYAYAVTANSAVTANFNAPINPTSMTGVSFTLKGGATPVSGSATYSGNTATFTPSTPLAANTVYTATVTADVKDAAGNVVNSNYSWTFQTFADGSSTGPVNPPPAGLWQPAAGTTPATGSYVYLKSDVGDYIGAGNTYTYTKLNATLTVSENAGHLSVAVNGNQVSWFGDFQAMNTIAKIQPGFYPGLLRHPFNNPAYGGLAWYGNGNGCNTLKGWFAVDSVVYDINGALTAIDLRFEQNCEGGITALHGKIHWTP